MSNDQEAMMPVVHILDDDLYMREALTGVLQSLGLLTKAFESAEDFLENVGPDDAGCLLLDVRLPTIDGLDLQHELQAHGYRMPIIFITGYGSIPMTVQAMRAGAVDFLTKPFGDEELIRAVNLALDNDLMNRMNDARNEALLALANRLTNRERQVMSAVVRGLMNKQIAYELSLTEITVKLHRASLMRKMKARTLPDLVRKAEALCLLSQPANSTPAYSSDDLHDGITQ